MARIRSLKPEAFASESLAKVSVNAERTFYGMSTIADDRGRLTDKPAQINGDLWSMRGGHGTADLEGELQELTEADGLVCRYTGCNGKRYLHLVTWDWHQKIDHPGKTHLPRCPHHPVSVTGKAEDCGLHPGPCPVAREPLASPREDSRRANGGDEGLARAAGAAEGTPAASEDSTSEGASPDQRTPEPSRNPRESSRDVATDLGPRTVDLGPRTVPPSAGAGKPRRRSTANAGDIVAAYVDGAVAAGLPRPDESLRKRIGKQAGEILGRGQFTFDALRAAAGNAGAVGWNDLAVQLQRDAAKAKAAANGSGPSPHREATTTQRVQSALSRAARYEREEGP